MENKAPRFVEETRESVDRWKELTAKIDVSRRKFEKNYGFLAEEYDKVIDELSGVKKRRRFVTEKDIRRGKVTITAWNRLPAIPGPSPEWFKSTTQWNTSADIGKGVKRSKDLISLDFKMSQLGQPLRKRNIFHTFKWPTGSVD